MKLCILDPNVVVEVQGEALSLDRLLEHQLTIAALEGKLWRQQAHMDVVMRRMRTMASAGVQHNTKADLREACLKIISASETRFPGEWKAA